MVTNKITCQQAAKKAGRVHRRSHNQSVVDPAGVVSNRIAHMNFCQISWGNGESGRGKFGGDEHEIGESIGQKAIRSLLYQLGDLAVANIRISPSLARFISKSIGFDRFEKISDRPGAPPCFNIRMILRK